jgi:hypothetical protein
MQVGVSLVGCEKINLHGSLFVNVKSYPLDREADSTKKK